MSRESEKLFEAIGRVADGQIEEAQALRERRRLRWIAPLAAVLALAIILTAVLSGPGGTAYAVAEPKYPKEQPIRVPPVGAEMVETFLRRGLPVLLSGQEGENQVCSPLNIYMALSMLAETAGGESRAQVLDLLGAEDMESQRAAARQLWERNYLPVSDDRYGACLLASSLWLDNDLSYKKETVDLLAKEYYATVFRGDLGSEKLNQALRDWLNAETGGLLAEQAAKAGLQPGTVLALAATVYFKGNWAYEFQVSETTEQVFTGPKGEQRCPFMHGTERGMYYWGEGFTAAVKGFTNSRSMLFVLPEEGSTPEDLLGEGDFMDLLAGGLNGWEGRSETMLHWAVPRFDLSCERDLLPALAQLGVTDLLDPMLADLSPIMDVHAALSQAEHACRVKVDEEGCEAAAYTLFGYTAGLQQDPPLEVDFTLDRPFLFAVLSTEGRPLFVGIVNDPTA